MRRVFFIRHALSYKWFLVSCKLYIKDYDENLFPQANRD